MHESLNFISIAAIVAFTITIIILLYGKKNLIIPCNAFNFWFAKNNKKNTSIKVSSVVYAPISGVLILFSFNLINLLFGLNSNPVVTTYDILSVFLGNYHLVVIILSFAYTSISLDRSGFFKWSAYHAARLASGSSLKLLIYLFTLCSVLTFVTSNDIVIVTMTPIILEIGRQTGIKNLIPLLISQFIAANTLSMGLYIGTPTNIVLADAAGFEFWGYFQRMALPALISFFVTLIMILILFHWFPINGNKMHYSYKIPKPFKSDGRDAEMKIKLAVAFVGLVLLSFSGYINIPIWVLCLFIAIVMIIIDMYYISKKNQTIRSVFIENYRRMPWPIAPFVFSFFIITNSLSKSGIVDTIASYLITGTESLYSLSVKFSFLSAISVNMMNDIPSSVFWTEFYPSLASSLSSDQYEAAIQGIILGANLGCYLTLIGALAGLMWISIIKKHEPEIGTVLPEGKDLFIYGSIIIIPVLLTTAFIIALQL